jgi:hypothetical protein
LLLYLHAGLEPSHRPQFIADVSQVLAAPPAADIVSVDKYYSAKQLSARSWHEALMCNLYSIKTRRADLARKFHLSDNRMAVNKILEKQLR